MVLVGFIFNLETPDTGEDGGGGCRKEGKRRRKKKKEGPDLRKTVFWRSGQSQTRRGRPENRSDRRARLVIVHVDVRTKRKS